MELERDSDGLIDAVDHAPSRFNSLYTRRPKERGDCGATDTLLLC
jgi:hypothetical protein